MIKVKFTAPLDTLTGGKREVEVSSEPTTLWGVLEALDEQFPGIGERLTNDAGELRRTINFYIGENDVRAFNDQLTPVNDGDEISIISAIAGG